MSRPLVSQQDEPKENRFDYSEKGCRDVFWLLLFFVHLGALLGCGVVYGESLFNLANKVDHDEKDVKFISIILGISVVIGIIFGYLWLELIKRYAAQIITLGIIVSSLIIAVAAIVSFALGLFFQSLMLLIIFLVQTLLFYFIRGRIPFAAAVLVTSSQPLRETKGPFVVTLLMALLTLVWMACWSFVALSLYVNLNGGVKGGKGVNGFAIFFLVFSFYWTVQVLKNIAHVTTAGVVASWWLTPGAPSPTWASFKRAITTSLGSICFGSLIVALLEAISFLLRRVRDTAREDGNCIAMCLACFLDCCISCINNLLQFFNAFAYTYVAIYGYTFVEASKHTWELFEKKGFWAVINSDLSVVALFLGCFIGGVVVGCVGGGIAYQAGVSSSLSSFKLALLAFVVGFTTISLLLSVVQSAITTTLVLWAEDPAAMSQRDKDTRTDYYLRLAEADPRLDSGI